MTIHVIYFSAIILILMINHIERRDLYNRIMSRSFNEYKSEKPKYYKSAHRRVLDNWKKRGDNE